MTKPKCLDLEKLKSDLSFYVDSLMINHVISKVREHLNIAFGTYQKYKDNPDKFKYDFPEFLGDLALFWNDEDGYSGYWEIKEYNDWLFRLVFQDVINEEKE